MYIKLPFTDKEVTSWFGTILLKREMAEGMSFDEQSGKLTLPVRDSN